MVIHGGAGTISKASMTDKKEREIRTVLKTSVQAGYRQLRKGACSAEAVVAAIRVMEDSPLFNARERGGI